MRFHSSCGRRCFICVQLLRNRQKGFHRARIMECRRGCGTEVCITCINAGGFAGIFPSGKKSAKAVKSAGRRNKCLYALEGAATVAGLLLAGCSTTAVPAVLSTPPAYTNTSIQSSIPMRSQARKTRVVTASRYDPSWRVIAPATARATTRRVSRPRRAACHWVRS
jgi:hypothetical protein